MNLKSKKPVLLLYGLFLSILTILCLFFNPPVSAEDYVHVESATISGHWATLLLIIPLYFTGVVLWIKNHFGGRPLVAGTLGTLTYNFIWLSIVRPLEILYPAYLIGTGLSLYLTGYIISRILSSKDGKPIYTGKGHALYLVAFILIFTSMWTKEIGSSLIQGTQLRHSLTWHTPTSPVFLLDIAIFFPALALIVYKILKRDRSSGELFLSAVWMILTLSGSLISNRLWVLLSGESISMASLIFMFIIFLSSVSMIIASIQTKKESVQS